ncbi:hypothetical protein Gogos_021077 [Gossypium gossypioides]|uniref:Uncharacterized protein n=1 Tax=Gossypium gossypioides TaxID=34282 RepID=A0A7J9CU68_GOSGO|nr:hypothetical protein [Gossypium gossypioides]MBA0755026.1 hypothetical protein [Gossypium gossypioides]
MVIGNNLLNPSFGIIIN